jgi:hypothetical protein
MAFFRIAVGLALAFLLPACGDDAVGAGGAGGGASTGTQQGPGSGPSSTATGSNAASTGSQSTSSGSGGGPVTPIDCAPLDPPAGQTIQVDPSQARSLQSIVYDAPPGATIVLAPGTYTVPGILQLRSAGVTVRSSNDDAASVVLDGDYAVNEIFQVTASDVTIAHVTVTRAIDHPVHVFPPGNGQSITGFRLYGVHLVDGGEQFLKVNDVGDGGWVDQGRVECSTFQMTAAGRPNVESCCGGCYTGGIDVHAGWGWVVARNRFDGIYCENGGLAEHAIHFWKSARDTLVEGNVITNCARGIGFGLGSGVGTRVYPDNPHGGTPLAHIDGIIRNNFIYSDIDFFDTGIEIQEAREPLVLHNTVVSNGGAAFFSSIDYRFASTVTVIKNNLTTRISQRDGATGDVSNNLEDAQMSFFVDPAVGDLHLTGAASAALDAGAPHAEAGLDIDGEAHDPAAPDVGADEQP